VALLIEVLTDNRNRSGSDVRSTFTKRGGSMAEPGAVAWQFERKGVIVLPKKVGEDELMEIALEAGAEDIADQGDTFDITTAPTDFTAVRDALTEAGIALASADLTMIASTAVPLTAEADARKVLRVLDALEDNDDVQSVYANFDIPDEIFQAVSAE
jgi:YebC/PmpR family DNA-binding regulatory protein